MTSAATFRSCRSSGLSASPETLLTLKLHGVQGVGPAMTLLQSGRVSTPTMGATCLRSLMREVVVAGVADLS